MFKFRKSTIKHLLLFDLLLKQDIYFVLSYDFIYKETYLHIINVLFWTIKNHYSLDWPNY
jgi:hypothetical protein